MPAARTMTAREFVELPPAELGRPWNLVEGEIVVNEPTVLHQRIVLRLALVLTSWASAHPGRGEVCLSLDVLVDDRNVYAPDLLWYAEGRTPGGDASAPFAMPDLAVEVRSRSTWRYDIGSKKAGYEREGLPELWLVDTAACELLVFRRSEPGAPAFDVALALGIADVLSTPMMPGLALPVERVFGGS